PEKVTCLLKKGVRMMAPFSVEIGQEVNPERIDGSLIIYGAARICGGNTLIAQDVQLGYEAPVNLINCQLGEAVQLRGGYFSDSVFLDKVTMGSNAQVRSGCLLEEESGGNHTVGLKQTILFPFVTLGSLINFCDCLMAGGTSRENHSEVGSSYIHFNYTPQQDKATASLIGDVPRGVMLREYPIFLGGQGGMVGPLKIAYGTVIPAGVICRRDCMAEGMLWSSSASPNRKKESVSGAYGDISRKVNYNIDYIANLLALRQWYKYVRKKFFIKGKYGEDLYAGACKVLNEAVAERIKQVSVFAKNLENSAAIGSKKTNSDTSANVKRTQKLFLQNWPQMSEYLCANNEDNISPKVKEKFIKIMQAQSDRGLSYLESIQMLVPAQAQVGNDWLNSIVEDVTTVCLKTFNIGRLQGK
ncbi:MAG: UDP-N-acetylglucosamine pyrophosphorylase, partial [Smithellaceae bacterium]